MSRSWCSSRRFSHFLLVLSPLVILGLDRAGRLTPSLKADLWQRYGRGW